MTGQKNRGKKSAFPFTFHDFCSYAANDMWTRTSETVIWLLLVIMIQITPLNNRLPVTQLFGAASSSRNAKNDSSNRYMEIISSHSLNKCYK
jgi:hypothetical protein